MDEEPKSGDVIGGGAGGYETNLLRAEFRSDGRELRGQ